MVQTDSQQTTTTEQSQVGRRIFRATGALMVIQVILRFFGMIEKMIMSAYFGTGDEANAYSAARKIAAPIMAFGEQVIMHSFLPPFVQRMREHGERDSWRMASTVINLMVVAMALLALFGLLYTPGLLALFVPGWKGEATLVPLTLQLTRVMLVAMIFLAVSSVTYCLLNSHKQFALPAASDLALKGTVLVLAIFFARDWGAYALAIGFVIGAAAKLIVQSVGLGRRMANYRPALDMKNPGLKQFGLLSLPLIVGWAFSTFRGLMELNFLSHIRNTGNVSAYDYAKTICDIPVQFFPYVFGIALFPFLTDIAVAGDKARLRQMLMTATRMMFLIFVPLAIAVIIFRYPIILGLYGSNVFDMQSAHLTAAPLQVFALLMLVGALEIIVNQFYFAMSDTVRPTVTGMVLIPLYAIVGYVGVIVMGWGAIAVALALFVYKAAKVTVLFMMIRKKLGELDGALFLVMLGKQAIALIPFTIILLLAESLLPTPEHVDGKLGKIFMLLPYMISGGVGMLVYFTILHYLRVEELTLLMEKVRGKLKRRAPRVATPLE